MSTLSIKKVGITNTGAEAVVNAANEWLQEGGGVCGYIIAQTFHIVIDNSGIIMEFCYALRYNL